MFRQFFSNCKVIRVENAVVAGTSDQEGTGVDMTGFGAVAFLALFGTLTAGQVTKLKAQQSDDDGDADAYSDLEGSATAALADGDSNDMLGVEVYRPLKRYVRPVVDRGTQNAVIDGVIAILFNAEDRPITADATLIDTVSLSSPAEGTA